jgi:two-component system, OmpR family, sensor histidine kinase BaeS
MAMSKRSDGRIEPTPVRRVPGIAFRLLLAQTVVLVAGAATTGIVAAIVGPPLFREYLLRTGVPHASVEQVRAEQAYRYATALSVAVALGVAALTALVVTWYLSRRLQRSVAEISSAATAVANGRYDIRVSPPGLGEDFQALARAFNQMAQQLESVETTRRQLFGDLAHEIRTPVSVVEAYLEALEDDVNTLDPDTITMLREQARRLVRFSDDFAALAMAEEGRTKAVPTWISPDYLISTALAAAADRYQAKNVALTSHIDATLPQVCVDPQRLAQVLANLLDNALRHTPPRGHVDVVATADKHRLTIAVTDTGDGIAAEHLPHVFERFYRVDAARDREHGGAGIGLAIAKALVNAHGGHITASSCGPGTGTTFTITLPIDQT